MEKSNYPKTKEAAWMSGWTTADSAADSAANLSVPLLFTPICALYKSAGNEKIGSKKINSVTVKK